MSWGSGNRGQLGLGEDVVDRRTPRVIRGLAGVPVRSVVAGAAHALCVTLDGKVWVGSAEAAESGHGDGVILSAWMPAWVESRVRNGERRDAVANVWFWATY